MHQSERQSLCRSLLSLRYILELLEDVRFSASESGQTALIELSLFAWATLERDVTPGVHACAQNVFRKCSDIYLNGKLWTVVGTQPAAYQGHLVQLGLMKRRGYKVDHILAKVADPHVQYNDFKHRPAERAFAEKLLGIKRDGCEVSKRLLGQCSEMATLGDKEVYGICHILMFETNFGAERVFIPRLANLLNRCAKATRASGNLDAEMEVNFCRMFLGLKWDFKRMSECIAMVPLFCDKKEMKYYHSKMLYLVAALWSGIARRAAT